MIALSTYTTNAASAPSTLRGESPDTVVHLVIIRSGKVLLLGTPDGEEGCRLPASQWRRGAGLYAAADHTAKDTVGLGLTDMLVSQLLIPEVPAVKIHFVVMGNLHGEPATGFWWPLDHENLPANLLAGDADMISQADLLHRGLVPEVLIGGVS
jgi:hypothetical protein